MKKVLISVRDFALPVPRLGSIEQHSGYGRPNEGAEIHTRIQQSRLEEDGTYEAEKKITAEFERGGFLFQVGGRVDGYFPSDPPRIEEIKSCFNLKDLEKKLRGCTPISCNFKHTGTFITFSIK